MTDEPDMGDDAIKVWAALLHDPNVVHLNMLRGSIAKLTPAHIGHLYRGEEGREVIAEIYRQNPDIAAKLVSAENLLGARP